MKLVMSTLHVHQKCKLCDKIETKMRRRAAEVDRIHRWQRDGGKFRASIDKSMSAVKTLDMEIYTLGRERTTKLQAVNSR